MIYCSHSGGPYEGMYLDVLQFWDTLWLWLTVRHGISMAHRNRWFTVFKNGGSFHGELLVITRWYIEGMGLPQGCHPSFLRERRGENSEARNPEKRFLWSFLQWWNGDFPRRKKNQAPFLRLRRKVTLVSIKSFLGFHPTFLCFRGVRFPETSAAPNSADNEAASGGKTNRWGREIPCSREHSVQGNIAWIISYRMFSLALKPPVFRSPKWLGITNQSLCWEFTVGSLHIIEIIISKWYTFYIHMYITIYKEI